MELSVVGDVGLVEVNTVLEDVPDRQAEAITIRPSYAPDLNAILRM
jgi:hypothetical protein